MKPFEIFKPGTHTPMSGKPIAFSEEVVKAIAAAYDPARHEAPVVIGHPRDDGPAWGWVKGLEFRDGALVAELDQVDPAFAEIVEAGRFKKVSASFYPADHPSNPTPGQLALRHVGVLGATAPGVKGLKPISFGDDDAEVLNFEFAEDDAWRTSWVFGTIGRALQAMREFIVVERGEEAADKAIPKYDIEEVHRHAGALQERARKTESPAFSETNLKPNEEPAVNPKTQEQEASAAKIAADQAKLDADRLAFAEQQKQARRATDKAALDALSVEGKLAPGIVAPLLDFMEGLDAGTPLEFGEGDGVQKKTPHEFFLDLLKQSGKVIEFGERSAPEGDDDARTLAFAAPPGTTVDPEGAALHRKALDYQAKHAGTDYMAAVAAVGGR
ncbi:MAG: hypothetical protein Q7V31_03725 [Parvibaculum sp.]|uniref:hypothetical protein n=1 Tax=Parvibaculum sp. TaxID=2024848 RepID=UPI002727FCD7|nr:hypothetical protein [Parvibaculum sp.]MDO8838012.1 hypothetical protein [Parvibaculum sp.]